MAIIRQDVLHAAGRIEGVAGGIIVAMGVASSARNGVGDYSVTLDEGIAGDDRAIICSPDGANTGRFCVRNNAGETATVKPFLTFNAAGAAADQGFSFVILRLAPPP